MADVLVLGGGVCGLATAMMLARDGHDVRVLERDPVEPPDDPRDAWTAWDRKGVRQFHQPHNLHARARHILAAELPDVLDASRDAGMHRFDPLGMMPPTMAGESRPDDDRFWTYNGRRPVLEGVFARIAAREPQLDVVRGVRVTNLVAGPEAVDGVPHIVGVETERHGTFHADHVVDAMGRLSSICDLVEAVGGRRPYEESEDCRFSYYTRYFRSKDGSVPQLMGPVLSQFDTFSVLTLAGDNGHWSVTLFSSIGERAHVRLKEPEVWRRVVEACPLIAHWLDGEPISDILPIAGISDRYRRFVVDDAPVVTGLSVVADAWACTNPSAGRGISIGLIHAQLLRDTMRKHLGSPDELARVWDEVTEHEVTPWYRLQVGMDRARVRAMDAATRGETLPMDPDDPLLALLRGMRSDPDLLRAFTEIVTCLALPREIFARPGFVEKVFEAARDAEPIRLPGPDAKTFADLLAC